MDLSHQSITGQQFELNRRGYDPDAVDAHLAQIAAATAERENRMAEMERTMASLAAKVQDANESEEALRLTLKAAAHAKEELLAGAREQAKATQDEAEKNAERAVREAGEHAERAVREAEEYAQRVVSEADSSSQATVAGAQAQAEAMTANATAQAQDVARAALTESELLVERIEDLRGRVAGAENALRSLDADASPRLESAREALDSALEQARASAENPELLAAASTPPSDTPPIVAPFSTEPPVDEPAAKVTPESPEPQYVEEPAIQQAPADPPPAHESTAPADEGPPHLEVVEPPASQAIPEPAPDSPTEAPESGDATESTADISDKVDRLLEELREVT